MTKQKPDDALNAARESLRKASETLGRMDARGDASDKIDGEKPDTLFQKVKDMAIAARRINKIWDASQELYQKVSPVIGPVLKPAVWVAGRLGDTFKFAAYEHDSKGMKLDAEGDPIFSPGRLVRTFATAVALGSMATVGMSAAYFHGTHFQETIVTNGKQQIEAGQLYEFGGCTSMPCDTKTDNGKYYHVEYSMLFPTLLRPEEDVFSLIPADTAVCEIEGYGIYFKELKGFFKWAEWYQNVYDVSCRPMTESEIQHSLETGTLPTVVPLTPYNVSIEAPSP